MFAVIKTGGKQYRVQEGDVLQVEKLNMKKGQKFTFDKILLIEDKGKTLIGTPFVEKALVRAEVVDNVKSKKVVIFKKKRRKQYRRKSGHRQELSQIRIEEILPSGKPVVKRKPVEVRMKKELDDLEKQKGKKVQAVKEAKTEESKKQLKKKGAEKKARIQKRAKTDRAIKSETPSSERKIKSRKSAKARKSDLTKEKKNGT